jgi:PadR family transcriptional regulator, regulatory protein PadR
MRLSYKGLRVLATFVSQPATALAGSDLYRETGIGSGTIYPLLARFERAGWLSAEWERIDPVSEGRPAKKLYRLTALGSREAQRHLAELDLVAGGVRWAH